tara:strand:- start:35 stop:328 length:294 start_codon:yes stop_codon:yes gene_type:complete
MRFLEILSRNKLTLVSIFLLLYVSFNLFDGERGLISYLEKKKVKNQLTVEKEIIINKLSSVEKKNKLLTEEVDLDYLETLYRKKFMVGKEKEEIYKN